MKNLKRLLLAIAFVIFSFGDAEAMNPSYSASQESNFDMKKPLSEWPRVHPFSSQKEMDYYKKGTWNSKLTLEQNQKALVKKFVNECCDFSFKITKKSQDLCLGELDSSKKILFNRSGNDDLEIFTKSSNGRLLELFVNINDQEFSLPLDTPVVTKFLDMDSMEKYKGIFENYFKYMSQDPVGCKLFRVLMTKIAISGLPKIIFIPVSGSELDIMGRAAIYPANDIGYISGLKKMGSATRFILFDPRLFISKRAEVCLLRYDGISRALSLGKTDFGPVDSTLFHEMVHWLHHGKEEKFKSNLAIEKRLRSRIAWNLSREKYNKFRKENNKMYTNDEEYHTMFGLTEQGLDLLNESSYSSHRYGFTHLSHLVQPFEVMREVVMTTDWLDGELFNYYLSPDSPIKHPKFGVGQYKCADLDPKTGKKVGSAL